MKKPSEVLELYSKRLTEGLEKKLSPSAFELTFSFRSPRVAALSGVLVFRSGHVLEFDEILKQTKDTAERVKYRYHVMDKDNNLVFRYDNVPHHKNVKTFPHHKHIADTVIDSDAPTLLDVVYEVEFLVLKAL